MPVFYDSVSCLLRRSSFSASPLSGSTLLKQIKLFPLSLPFIHHHLKWLRSCVLEPALVSSSSTSLFLCSVHEGEYFLQVNQGNCSNWQQQQTYRLQWTVEGMCVSLASARSHLQNLRALILLGEKLQYKFINYLCVMRQETDDFVNFILKDFDLRKLPQRSWHSFLWNILIYWLEKMSTSCVSFLALWVLGKGAGAETALGRNRDNKLL